MKKNLEFLSKALSLLPEADEKCGKGQIPQKDLVRPSPSLKESEYPQFAEKLIYYCFQLLLWIIIVMDYYFNMLFSEMFSVIISYLHYHKQ